MKKVVVTGLGLITSLGADVNSTWNNLLNGKSGVGPITLFDTANFRTKIAAQVPEGDLQRLRELKIKKRVSKQMTRAVQMNFLCAQMAIDDASLAFQKMDTKRCGIIIGAAGSDYSAEEMAETGRFDQSRIIKSMVNAHPSWISLHYNIEGPSMSVATACASAGNAIAIAFDYIAAGLCDVVITGGTSASVMPEYLAGFGDMMALSENNDAPEEASRPFDKRRDGFVMGEGSGMLVLESEEHAKARKVRIYTEIRRPALLSEGYNIMAPQKDGVGMSACMDLALKQARLNPEDVDYINAHGTSTPLNDLYETLAIKRTFGTTSRALAVSSTKSMTGHCLAAAGGIEAVITCKAIEQGVIPPTTNQTEPDPELDLNYVPNVAIEKKINAALSNSFAFGGHNAVIPFHKYI